MTYGCFVDIRQQDGQQTRMHYRGMDIDTRRFCEWVGIMEQMTDKFRQETTSKKEV